MTCPCAPKQCGTRVYTCPMELALQVIGGKWKLIILWHLNQDGVLRFSQIKKIIPSITPKMLTQQLRELETDGLVHRTVYPQVPPKVEYSLTELGKSLYPILNDLNKWGGEFAEKSSGQLDRQAV